MSNRSNTGLLFLHALPLNADMWNGYADLIPQKFYAPTLYDYGESVESWADAILEELSFDRMIVVGCSVGGSCALEVAVAAEERIAALVLIGTKAAHDPDTELHSAALRSIQEKGMDHAWSEYWEPLFSRETNPDIVMAGKRMMDAQNAHQISSGVTAFHTRQSRDRFVSDFDKPVYVISGDADTAPGLPESQRLASSAPQGHFRVIKSCGHYAPLERPKEFRKILTEVIENHV